MGRNLQKITGGWKFSNFLKTLYFWQIGTMLCVHNALNGHQHFTVCVPGVLVPIESIMNTSNNIWQK